MPVWFQRNHRVGMLIAVDKGMCYNECPSSVHESGAEGDDWRFCTVRLSVYICVSKVVNEFGPNYWGR